MKNGEMRLEWKQGQVPKNSRDIDLSPVLNPLFSPIFVCPNFSVGAKYLKNPNREAGGNAIWGPFGIKCKRDIELGFIHGTLFEFDRKREI